MRTERVIGCTQKAPRWVVKVRAIALSLGSDWPTNTALHLLITFVQQLLGGSSDAYVREVSHLNPNTGETHVTSVNLSLCQYLTVLERISYKPCPANPTGRTLFTQTAEIQARIAGWRPLQERFERWSLEMFDKNAEKGREGFEHVLRTLWETRQGLIAGEHKSS